MGRFSKFLVAWLAFPLIACQSKLSTTTKSGEPAAQVPTSPEAIIGPVDQSDSVTSTDTGSDTSTSTGTGTGTGTTVGEKPGPFEITQPRAVPVLTQGARVRWTAAANAKSYEVVVASDEACQNVLAQKTVIAATETTLGELPRGIAHVCVTAKNGNAPTTPASNDGTRFHVGDIVLGQSDFVTSTAAAGASGLYFPASAIFAGDRVIVADSSNNRILIWNQRPFANATPADVVLGQPDFDTTDWPLASASSFGWVETVVVANGKLLVADAENNRVLIWNAIPTVSNTPADVVLGQPDMTHADDTPASDRTLVYPVGIAVADGRLYVADDDRHRILVWNQIPTTSFAPADFAIGQPTLNDEDLQPASATSLKWPAALVVAGNQLICADYGYNRILVWNLPLTSNRAADYVLGQTSFNQDAVRPISGSSTNYPWGMGAGIGRLLVGDYSSNRILAFASPVSQSGASAMQVLGQPAFNSNSGPGQGASLDFDTLSSPYTASGSVEGTVLITDSGNNRVLWRALPSEATDSGQALSVAGALSDGYINQAEAAVATPLIAQTFFAPGRNIVGYAVLPGSAPCDGTATFSATPPTTQAPELGTDDTYWVCIKLFDTQTSQTSYFTSPQFTVDTEPPNPFQISQPYQTANVSNPTVGATSWTGCRVDIKITRDPAGTDVVLGTNNVKLSPLADGDYFIFLDQVDCAGNKRSATNNGRALTIDTVPHWQEMAHVGYNPVPAMSYPAAVWTGAKLLVWGEAWPGDAGEFLQNTAGGVYDPSNSTWTRMATSGQPRLRSHATSVWTGSRMLVWGGSSYNDPLGSFPLAGGSYNPVMDVWQPMATSNSPQPRTGQVGVWTGSKLIVWGGKLADNSVASDGGVYDPVTDTWTAMSSVGAPAARTDHVAIWTGTEMIVWGGTTDGSTYLNSGGRYNPATDTWTAMSPTNAPSGRRLPAVAWSGTEALFWGGDANGQLNDGARYDPLTNSWTTMGTLNAPTQVLGPFAAWTGTKMLVWSGAWSPEGGLYDPLTDTWTPTSTTGIGYRMRHAAVWTGTEMIAWGGAAEGRGSNSLDRYTPLSDTWVTENLAKPGIGNFPVFEWSGSRVLAWGGVLGSDGYSGPRPHGYQYDPVLDIWTPMSAVGQPSHRGWSLGSWSGTELLVWGPSNSGTAAGGRYNPTTDTWAAMATLDQPGLRNWFSLTWTGSELFVWGGHDDWNVLLGDGALYDPLSDTWRPISMVGAPAPRHRQTAVWTGSRVIVYGGCLDLHCAVRATGGGVYDPSNDTWQTISTVGAPDADLCAKKYNAVVPTSCPIVWTGDRLLAMHAPYLGAITANPEAALFDPDTNTWTAVDMTFAPFSSDAALVKGGSKVYFVGGSFGRIHYHPLAPVLRESSGVFNLLSNTWESFPAGGTPPYAAGGANAVWAGDRLVVWGGINVNNTRVLDKGYIYQ